MGRQTLNVVLIGEQQQALDAIVSRLTSNGFDVTYDSSGEPGSKLAHFEPGSGRLAALLEGIPRAGLQIVALTEGRFGGRRHTASGLTGEVITRGELTIHTTRYEVHVAGRRVPLTLREFELLVFLAQQPGDVFTRDEIVTGVAGKDYPVTGRSVDVQVAGLRRKLGACGRYIQTVRGVGYRFQILPVDDNLRANGHIGESFALGGAVGSSAVGELT